MRQAWIVMILAGASSLLGPARAREAEMLSDAAEVKIGRVLAQKYETANGIGTSEQTRKIETYLQKVGEKVAAGAERKLPYQFHFDANPAFRSAVGLPGGQIYVGAGILSYIDTEDQLAAVLGHEIEHINLSQCRERLEKILAEGHLTAEDAEKLEIDPFLDGYGHDSEFAADREGVKLAATAGYSAEGAVRLLRTFVILGEQMPNSPKEAKENLEARIAQIQPMAEQSLALRRTEKPLGLAP
ncbi:MAG: M48 family metallopeptidase [Candidatus Acidiferrum sp.]